MCLRAGVSGAAGVRALPQPTGYGRANTPGSPKAKGEIESGMMKNGEMGSPELIEVSVWIKVTEGQEDWTD